jgi:16S rRNA (guanine527-N7)-methyltransferase
MSDPPLPSSHDTALVEALAISQRLGMLGSRPVDEVIDQATAFVAALDRLAAGALVVDLGSGGGVPGLVIAWLRPDLDVVLVDRRATRVDHLRRLISRLGLGDRVSALTLDAGAAVRSLPRPPDAFVARGFGGPEALLATVGRTMPVGSILAIAEPPPTAPDRWVDELLGSYHLVRDPSPDARVAILRRVG